MTTLLIAVGAFVGYLIAYHTYGRWLARRIFKLDPAAPVPSVALNDDTDYVPTARSIVFGHHFTSIAGTGPIVGPAIAVMWGWLPALLWVLLGSIFIGAVHDFGALVVSLRNRGQTVGDIAGRVLNPRVRILFLFVLFLALTIVLAIFGLVIAAVFRMYPASIFPCIVQIPLAIAIGLYLHRKGVHLLVPSLITLAVMYVTVIFGDVGVLGDVNKWLAGLPTIVWVAVLLVYSYIASVLPVWTLLQPRDYINSLQLLTALGLIMLGLAAAALVGGAPAVEGGEPQPLEIVAPVVNWNPTAAPMIFPFLFITIACGAISGFHCLVSSGTSSKQLKCESDAQFVGYGSMLTEGFLATLVILACVAGLGMGIPLKTDGPESLQTANFYDSQGQPRTAVWTPVDENRVDVSAGHVTDPHDLPGESLSSLTQSEELAALGILATADANGPKIRLQSTAAYNTRYGSWYASNGLDAKVGAFVDGSGNFLKALGIPAGVAVALMGVLVASFAGTTLDTACRLQRYVTQELTAVLSGERRFSDAGVKHKPRFTLPLGFLTNKHAATIFAIVIAAAIASLSKPGLDWSWKTAGTGGMILWPMFGATNQLLGGLAFLVTAFWLWRRRLPVWFIVVPMGFMLAMPAWAMAWQLFVENPGTETSPDATPGWLFAENKNWTLITVALATLALEAWLLIEAFLAWPKARGVLEETLPPLPAQPTYAIEGGRSC